MATKKSTSSKVDTRIGNQLLISFDSPNGDQHYLRLESIAKIPKGKTAFLLKAIHSIEPVKKKPPNHNKNTDAYYDSDKGTDKYYIVCARLSIYTAIGADNRHHAANKATKLFGPNWSSLTMCPQLVQYLKFEPVVYFKELISGL